MGGAAGRRDERAPHLPVRRGERQLGGHRDAGRLAGEGQGRRALGRPARLRGVRADQQDGGGRDPVPALHLRRQHGHLHPGRGSRRHPEHRRRRGGGHRQGQHRPAVGDLHQRPEPDGRDQHLRGEGGRRVEPGRELGQPDGSPRYPGEHRSGRRRHLLGGRARRQDLGGVEQAGPDPAHRSLGVRVLRRGARRQRHLRHGLDPAEHRQGHRPGGRPRQPQRGRGRNRAGVPGGEDRRGPQRADRPRRGSRPALGAGERPLVALHAQHGGRQHDPADRGRGPGQRPAPGLRDPHHRRGHHLREDRPARRAVQLHGRQGNPLHPAGQRHAHQQRDDDQAERHTRQWAARAGLGPGDGLLRAQLGVRPGARTRRRASPPSRWTASTR